MPVRIVLFETCLLIVLLDGSATYSHSTETARAERTSSARSTSKSVGSGGSTIDIFKLGGYFANKTLYSMCKKSTGLPTILALSLFMSMGIASSSCERMAKNERHHNVKISVTTVDNQKLNVGLYSGTSDRSDIFTDVQEMDYVSTHPNNNNNRSSQNKRRSTYEYDLGNINNCGSYAFDGYRAESFKARKRYERSARFEQLQNINTRTLHLLPDYSKMRNVVEGSVRDHQSKMADDDVATFRVITNQIMKDESELERFKSDYARTMNLVTDDGRISKRYFGDDVEKNKQFNARFSVMKLEQSKKPPAVSLIRYNEARRKTKKVVGYRDIVLLNKHVLDVFSKFQRQLKGASNFKKGGDANDGIGTSASASFWDDTFIFESITDLKILSRYDSSHPSYLSKKDCNITVKIRSFLLYLEYLKHFEESRLISIIRDSSIRNNNLNYETICNDIDGVLNTVLHEERTIITPITRKISYIMLNRIRRNASFYEIADAKRAGIVDDIDKLNASETSSSSVYEYDSSDEDVFFSGSSSSSRSNESCEDEDRYENSEYGVECETDALSLSSSSSSIDDNDDDDDVIMTECARDGDDHGSDASDVDIEKLVAAQDFEVFLKTVGSRELDGAPESTKRRKTRETATVTNYILSTSELVLSFGTAFERSESSRDKMICAEKQRFVSSHFDGDRPMMMVSERDRRDAGLDIGGAQDRRQYVAFLEVLGNMRTANATARDEERDGEKRRTNAIARDAFVTSSLDGGTSEKRLGEFEKRDAIRSVLKSTKSYVALSNLAFFRVGYSSDTGCATANHKNYDEFYYQLFHKRDITNYQQAYDIGKKLYEMSHIAHHTPIFSKKIVPGRRNFGVKLLCRSESIVRNIPSLQGHAIDKPPPRDDDARKDDSNRDSRDEPATTTHAEVVLNLKNHAGNNASLWNQISSFDSNDLNNLVQFLLEIEKSGVKYVFYKNTVDRRGLESKINGNGRLILSRYQ